MTTPAPAVADAVGRLPMLVGVPGLGLSPDVLGRVLRRLAPPQRWRTIALPGFGVPAGPGVDLSPAALARPLLERLGEAGASAPVVLVGHSASCHVVVEAALQAPDLVSGLVLVGPTTDPRAASWPGLARRWLLTAVAERPGQVPILVRDYRRTGVLSMRRAMNAVRHHRIDLRLAEVQADVLVVRGRRDAIAPAVWTAHLAATAPRGRAVTLAAGAHMVPLTHPNLLSAAMIDGGGDRDRSQLTRFGPVTAGT